MAKHAEKIEYGTAKTRMVGRNIIETVYEGRMSPDMVDEVRREIEPLLEAAPGSSWLADTSQVTTYTPAPRASVSAFLESFRKLGGSRIAVVITSSPLRMLVSAFRFATRLPIHSYPTREQALEFLRGEREGSDV